MVRTTKKFFKNRNKKRIKCTGCGRHEREVPEESNWYFCNHCVSMNNNYGRFKAGLPLIKPLEKIKEGDTIIDACGKPYLIIKESYKLGEDTWYICKEMFGKENEVELGDFTFYKKTGKREINKINKVINSGNNSFEFTTNYENKQTCLECKFCDRNLIKCLKKDASLLSKDCEANNCDFYKPFTK